MKKSKYSLGVILILFLLSLGAAGCAGHRWQGVIKNLEAKGKFAEVNGLKVFYREAGSGPAIILIHGFASSSLTWEKVMPELAKNFHVYAPDVAGFGLTEKPKDPQYYSFDAYVELIRGFMEALKVEKAIMVGNSMGGSIAAGLALSYPQRVEKLVFVDPGVYPLKPPLPLKLYRMPVLGDIGRLVIGRWLFVSSLKEVYYDDHKLTDEWIDSYYAPFTLPNGTYGPQVYLRTFHKQLGEITQRLPEVSQPTLIIWGENDLWIPVRDGHQLQQDIKNSRLEIIPQCGHVPQEEKPEAFLEAINQFLP